MLTKVTSKAATITITFALLTFGILLLPYVVTFSSESERVVRLFGSVLAIVFFLSLGFVVVGSFGRSR